MPENNFQFQIQTGKQLNATRQEKKKFKFKNHFFSLLLWKATDKLRKRVGKGGKGREGRGKEGKDQKKGNKLLRRVKGSGTSVNGDH